MHSLSINFAKPIRLFPLAGCVLIPFTSIPLRIFERRYRAMLRDALDSDGLIAMATYDADALPSEGDQAPPPLKPCVCIGHLVHHERLPDGRYNIVLQGLCRARITSEQPRHPDGYRQALLAPYALRADGGSTDPHAVEEVRHRLETLLEDPALCKLSAVAALHNLLNNELPTEVLVDVGLMAVAANAQERYAALAEADPLLRGCMLEGLLQSMRDIVLQADAQAAPLDEHGWSLN